ncbi:hypothetical protein EJ04DRAFT_520047 [Polyplosphaeria fusca]|uniref:Uncharacterized protein n=1 Tax=Polyplosphaeria fusca TaxID=682080 RepID=A0A9P4R8J4_9PLEO|nr:hypothetical protein EJ04DRAFT_520047 [Polyplosphaeria fusca]
MRAHNKSLPVISKDRLKPDCSSYGVTLNTTLPSSCTATSTGSSRPTSPPTATPTDRVSLFGPISSTDSQSSSMSTGTKVAIAMGIIILVVAIGIGIWVALKKRHHHHRQHAGYFPTSPGGFGHKINPQISVAPLDPTPWQHQPAQLATPRPLPPTHSPPSQQVPLHVYAQFGSSAVPSYVSPVTSPVGRGAELSGSPVTQRKVFRGDGVPGQDRSHTRAQLDECESAFGVSGVFREPLYNGLKPAYVPYPCMT